MLNIFRVLIDTIFPPHECLKIIKDETRESFGRLLFIHKHRQTVVLSDYTNKVVKAAVTANKFHNSELAALLLGSLIATWYQHQPQKHTLFVPIPLSKTREKKRGYNQVTRVLQNTPTSLQIKPLLKRTKDTKPQTSLPRSERLLNVSDAFSYVSDTNLTQYERIIIVDDVATTGATMEAAKKVLLEHLPKNCELICLALAN